MVSEKEIEQINKKIKKWQDAYEMETFSVEEISYRLKHLRQQKQSAEYAIKEMRLKIENEQNSKQTLDAFITALRDFDNIVSEATLEELKTAISFLVKQVKVYKDDRVEVVVF